MKKAKAPAPIDPRQTSAASTGTNISTAVANTAMGNVDQVGPDGSLTTKQTGVKTVTDPYTGQSYTVPTYTATTALSAPNQAIYDKTTANKDAMADKVMKLLAGFGTGDIRDRTEAALLERLRPYQDRDRQGMETRLANQGLVAGSRAYGAAQDDYGRSVNDARLGAILAAGGEERASRSQTLSEISMLQGGGSVNVPNYGVNRPAQAATTDTAGLINAQQQQQQQNFAQQQASNQGLLGGLFGLGSSLIMASDRRLKTDIDKVEDRPGDQPDVYDYRYKTDPKGTHRRGYMAQEVQKTHPEAVKKMGKYLAVDYSKMPKVR